MKVFKVDDQVVRKSFRRAAINYRWGWFFVSFNVAQNKSVIAALAPTGAFESDKRGLVA